jgi:alanine-glyoxylate transaminase / serine-glyoxylate transaminase / serine-pyruvate transaminase
MSETEVFHAFHPGRRVLLGPGPSEVPPRVLHAIAAPLVGHLDPAFLRLMTELQAMLRQVFKTQNQTTFAVSGTGMAGMEACLANLLEPGDKLLVGVNGVFSGRMVDMAQRMGVEVTTIERPWGETFDPDEVKGAIERVRPKAVGIVHAETSTGAWQPAEELGKICRERDALLILDTVTSLGGLPVEIDAWEVDAAYSGTQKCLSCPPGLSPVTFGPRAMDAIAKRKKKCQSWYLDVTMLGSYWGSERAYHHTAPISMNFALHEALRIVLEEGLEARQERHLRNHLALAAGLEAMGLPFTAAEGRRLPTLNAVRIPDGVDDAAVRKSLLIDFGIEIGGGLGAFRGKVWRIGLMGEGSNPNNVLLVLGALEQALAKAGHKTSRGAGVGAANAVYAGG